MSYLNCGQIEDLCLTYGEMLDFDQGCINAASLDVRLGDTIMVERYSDKSCSVDYRARQKLDMVEVKLTDNGYVIRPGEFFLAHTIEKCNFADDTAALFRIKSSMGRIGLEHMDAGWVDPGFHGALTLEFKNMTQWHSIRIRPGDRIGQLVFFKGAAVSADQSYRSKGNYNGEAGIAQIRFKK